MIILTKTVAYSLPHAVTTPLHNVSCQVVAYYKVYRFMGIYIENPTDQDQIYRIFEKDTLLGFAFVETHDSRLYFFDKQMILQPEDVYLEEHLEEYIYED
ncbi:hypothetical protein [Streptococcus himalayensis]|uniref:Uncharacterized protein n=1 Tax=Streptococcus himalayensis TaxID=1888195 RepID=A0A917A9Q6_9STRE|nr:hypothetical protein [Streptococcus himalayensis]GGE37199.1 hypothetical protein GCM10011510_18150 [Streptococcus himalayensis]